MSPPQPRSSACRAARALLWSLLVGALGAVAGCSSSQPEALPDEVRQLFDVANNSIADLTDGESEAVPRDDLLQAALRAKSAGTTMRIVIAAPDGGFIPASAIVDNYGGTAISYQANRTSFEGASVDMTGDQLDRAIEAARVQPNIGDSAEAFVGVIESEGLERAGTSWGRTALLLLLIPAAAFMLGGLWSYLKARSKRLKREDEFTKRRAVLTDWAAQLHPELDAIRRALARASSADRRIFDDSETAVTTVQTALNGATSVADLDGAEMRIGRTAIKLRDLRRSLGV